MLVTQPRPPTLPSTHASSVLAAPTAGRAATRRCPAARLAASRVTAGPCVPLAAAPTTTARALPTTAAPHLAFDGTGELLALAYPGGATDVMGEGDLHAWWREGGDGGGGGRVSGPLLLAPLLSLAPPMWGARAVAWDRAPGRADWLGVLESSSSSATASRLALYNLRTCGTGAPTRALAAGAATAATSASDGLTTLVSLSAGPAWPASTWAAGDGRGAVRVWDARAAGDRPVAWLAGAGRGGGGGGGGAVTALVTLGPGFTSGPPLLVGGAGFDGLLSVWDVRGGRSGEGGGAPSASLSLGGGGGLGLGGVPPLAAFSAAAALGRVPGLAAQAGPGAGACPVVSLHACPSTSSRLALHLDCGWSAVLEVGWGCSAAAAASEHVGAPPPPASVTHLHAPAWEADAAGGPALAGVGRRAPAWSPLTGTFIVPRVMVVPGGGGGGGGGGTCMSSCTFLDFSAGGGSPLAVKGDGGEEEGDADGSPPPSLPSALTLDVPGRVAALAVHPRSGELVGAGRGGGGGGSVGVRFFRGCV